MPTVEKITRHNGVAGQYSYTAIVTYPGEEPERVEFIGSVYGPPIVMVTNFDTQRFVSERVLERIGNTLNPEWVRRFFTDEKEN